MALSPTLSKDNRLFLLKKQDGDETVRDFSESSTSSGLYQTKLTLSFTPATTGDYLIIANAELQSDTNLQFTFVRVHDGSSNYQQSPVFTPFGGGSWNPYLCVQKVDDLSGSQTWTLDYRKGGFASHTVKIRNAYLIAIRLDNFDNVHYAEDLANSSTTSTTFTNILTLTATPQKADHLLIYGGQSYITNAIYASSVKMYDDNKDYGESYYDPYRAGTSDPAPFFIATKVPAENVSTDYKIDLKTENSSATATIRFATITLLQLSRSSDETLKIQGGNIKGANLG